MRTLLARLVLVLVLLPAWASCARAGFMFTEVASTDTPVPGGTGNFTFFKAPTISGGLVAFDGFGSGQGIYTGTLGGLLTRIVDTNTAIPGGTGHFTGFDGIFSSGPISGGTVAFKGSGSSGQQGIYTGTVGGVTLIADKHTANPSGGGNFFTFGGGNVLPSISGGTVAFLGATSIAKQGIYTGTGVGGPAILADRSTASPSGGQFSSLLISSPSMSGVTVAFVANSSSGQSGVYTAAVGGGSLTLIADKNSVVSGGGSIGSFGNPVISGGTVVFENANFSASAIYLASGGVITKIADTSTIAPGSQPGSFDTGNPGGMTFSFFGNASVSGGRVVFYALDSDNSPGLYLYTNGVISRIVGKEGTANFIDGQLVDDVNLSDNGLDGSLLTFEVSFTNGRTAIEVFNLDVPGGGGVDFNSKDFPEPSSLALFGLAGAALAGWRWRRRQLPA